MDRASSSSTETQRRQADLESLVGSLYGAFDSATNKERSILLKLRDDEHEDYLLRGLMRLSAVFSALDSSRPWLCYWILHPLALLGRSVDEDIYERTVQFLERCQDENGGYGGGPGQMPHMATTYAATCALVTLGGERALSSINRKTLLQFLLRMKEPCGGFRVHDDGEMDTRGSYTAMAVAHMLDIVVPELVEKVGEYVRSCQTYEGGIGGEPGTEAHGGYTFCGLAALALIDEVHVLDLPSLVNWVVFRQGKVEGGFQGRTNKLVDGCYSLWQGGCFRILQQQMSHLWMQQIATAAATSSAHHDATSPVVEPIGANSPERRGAADYDFEITHTHLEGEGASIVSEPQSGTHSQPDVGVEVAYVPEKGAARGEVFFQSDRAPEPKGATFGAEGDLEFYSPTKALSTHNGVSDEDEADYWDSISQESQATSEKLFPMPRGNFRVVSSQRTPVKLVELTDDDDERETEVTEACCSTSGTPVSNFDDGDDFLDGPIFNSQALQAYILLCCQDLDGGLRDKPGKPRDYYHSCYCLSGLSAAQHSTAHRVGAPPPSSGVVGPYSNLVEATHALCNVRLDRFNEARSYFRRIKD